MKRWMSTLFGLLAGHAFALSTTDALNANTVKLYLSGSPSVSGVIQGVMASNCVANTLTIYADASTGGMRHHVYTCTVNTTGKLATSYSLGGKNIAIFKEEFGGSDSGVFPVATRSAIPFLDLNTCGSGVLCSGETSAVPLLGYSDLEPKVFNWASNIPTGVTPLNYTQSSSLTVQPVLQQPLAVAVNNLLYTTLQQMQGTSGVPFLTHTQINSLVNYGSLSTTYTTWGYVTSTADPLSGSQINVCKGTRGSGIQAMANIAFSGACTISPDIPFSHNDSDAPDISNTTTYALYVSELDSAQAVGGCLNQVEAAGGYGIGYVSLLNPPAASDNWKIIGVDGNPPSITTTGNGQYGDVYESTFQYVTTAYTAASADQRHLVSGLISEVGNPAVMALAPVNTRTALLPLTSSHVFRGFSGDSCANLKLIGQ